MQIGKVVFVASLAVAFSASAKTVFLETEAFEDWGGWVNDTQFMDQMGSSYLLAHGMGRPVADAKTHFVLSDADGGTYAVWVRTKNWVAHVYARQGRTPPGSCAGTFEVVVNGKPLPVMLGTQGRGFITRARSFIARMVRCENHRAKRCWRLCQTTLSGVVPMPNPDGGS